MANNSPRNPRAELVGSLLRPAAITERIDSILGGMPTAWRGALGADRRSAFDQLDDDVDAVVPGLVARQVEAGLDVVTDGELRRSTFLGSFYDAVDGMEVPDERIIVHDNDGNVIIDMYNDPLIAGRIRKVANPLLREVRGLRGAKSAVPFKLTIPAPSYFLTDIPVDGPNSVYGSRREFVEDVVAIERELVAEAIDAGATWIQFDFPLYPALADAGYAEHLAGLRGESADSLLDLALDLDGRVAGTIPDDVNVGMHICRGNFEGGFWNGSLEPVAEAMFNRLPHSRFLIEWEDASREGDFSPLRHVPSGKVVALGLVSTKTPQLEPDDEVVRRIDEATAHLPLEQLALCPQCGFASLSHDHLVSAEDAQWRKLDLVGRVAERVWGGG